MFTSASQRSRREKEMDWYMDWCREEARQREEEWNTLSEEERKQEVAKSFEAGEAMRAIFPWLVALLAGLVVAIHLFAGEYFGSRLESILGVVLLLLGGASLFLSSLALYDQDEAKQYGVYHWRRRKYIVWLYLVILFACSILFWEALQRPEVILVCLAFSVWPIWVVFSWYIKLSEG